MFVAGKGRNRNDQWCESHGPDDQGNHTIPMTRSRRSLACNIVFYHVYPLVHRVKVLTKQGTRSRWREIAGLRRQDEPFLESI